MSLNFQEYRGVRDIVIAELTEKDNGDGKVTAEYGKVEQLSGIQSIGAEINEATAIHYYDNMPAIVVDSEGEDTYALVVSIPAKKTRAKIEGTTYDEKTGALIGTKKEKKYFALGFIAEFTDGTKEYNWIYKGKFTGGGKTHNTKDDGTDATNMEYTYTSIHTAATYKNAKNGPCKYLSVEDNGKADLSEFFKKVTTPDDLKEKAGEEAGEEAGDPESTEEDG